MAILIRNVKILSGAGEAEGAELPLRDVLISGQIISAIGNFPNKRAEEVIDGQGAYLAPGFIDIDNTSDHYLTIFTNPRQEDLLRQGITTIIGGQCGASLAPLLYGSLEAIRKWGDPQKVNVNWHTLQEFFTTLSRRPIGVNFGTLTGHSTIRRAILGEEIRDLTKNELAVFSGILQRSFAEGSFGISFGLSYVHTKGTAYKEIVALTREADKAHGIAALHLRKGLGLKKSIAEALKLHDDTGTPLLINHLVPMEGEEKEYENALENIGNVPKEERVHFSVYPFSGTVTALYALLPEWAQNGNLELMAKNVADSWLSKRILKDIAVPQPESLMIESASHSALEGHSLKSFMDISNISDPREGLLALMQATKLRAVVSMRNVDPVLLDKALWHPRSFIGTHAAARSETGAEETIGRERARHTFSEFLKMAAEKGSLEEAVKKITEAPAKMLGLKKRGIIQEGYCADIVLLRGAEVKTVIVNGVVALRDGVATGALAGGIVKHS